MRQAGSWSGTGSVNKFIRMALAGIREGVPLVKPAPDDALSLYFLSLFYAAYWCAMIMFWHGSSAATYGGQWSLFGWCWLVVPAMSMCCAIAVSVVRWIRCPHSPSFLPALLLTNLVSTVVAIAVLFERGAQGLTFVLIAVPLANVYVMVEASGWSSSVEPLVRWAGAVQALIPIIATGVVLTWCSRPSTAWNITGLAVAALVSWRHQVVLAWKAPRTAALLLDVAVCAFLLLAILDTSLSFDWYHDNFYLGPVADVLAGKSVLVDSFCQYGVGPVYVVAGFMKLGVVAPTYRGFSFLLSGLAFAQYVMLYAVLRFQLASQVLAILTLCVALAVNVYAPAGFLHQYPSAGPLRFGPAYVALVAVALGGVPGGWASAGRTLRVLALAMASVWSLETLCYVLAVLVAAMMHERRTIRSLAMASSVVMTAWLLAANALRLWAGEWPQPIRYLEYILPYARGLTGRPADPWSPWIAVIGVSLASVLGLAWCALVPKPTGARVRSPLLASTTALGVAQFTYFLAGANPVRLYHVAVPVIILAALWLDEVSGRAAEAPRALRASAAACVAYAAFVMLASALPAIEDKIPTTALYGRLGRCLALARLKAPSDAYAAQAARLVRKYAGDRPRVSLFLGPRYTPEVLLLCGKAHVFPINMMDQDALVERTRRHAVEFRHGLEPGEILIVQSTPYEIRLLQDERGILLQRDLLMRLEREFDLERVETASNGLAAIRLARKVPAR